MTNKTRLMLLVTMTVLLMLAATSVFAGDVESDLAALRRVTARFHRPEVAMAEGWLEVPGVDHCFEEPGVGGEGYHLLNLSLLDTTVNLLEPEALVYAPGPEGQRRLAAIAYVVHGPSWDAEGHDELPSMLGQEFHFFPRTGNYILHVWAWQHNPTGMFEDWHPDISCP